MKKTVILMTGLMLSASTFADDYNPEPVYQQSCSVCHQMGVANAPKTGDKAAWEEKIKAAGSKEAMIQSGINGKGAMPPRGAAAVSDEEFAKIVDYMMQ